MSHRTSLPHTKRSHKAALQVSSRPLIEPRVESWSRGAWSNLQGMDYWQDWLVLATSIIVIIILILDVQDPRNKVWATTMPVRPCSSFACMQLAASLRSTIWLCPCVCFESLTSRFCLCSAHCTLHWQIFTEFSTGQLILWSLAML